MKNTDTEQEERLGQVQRPDREAVPGSVPDGFSTIDPTHEPALAEFYEHLVVETGDGQVMARHVAEKIRTEQWKVFTLGERGKIAALAVLDCSNPPGEFADFNVRIIHNGPFESLRATSGLVSLCESEARSRGFAVITAPDVRLGSRNQLFLANRGYLPDDEFVPPLPRRRTWRLLLDSQSDYVAKLGELQSPGRALDVGAGLGEQAIALSDAAYEVVAVDNDPHSLAALGGASESLGSRFQVSEGDLATFKPSGEFDLVNMRHVLHFVQSEDVPAAIQRMQKHTTPSGLHYLTVWSDRNPPNPFRPHRFSEEELFGYYQGWEMLDHSHLEVSKEQQWIIELIVRKPLHAN